MKKNLEDQVIAYKALNDVTRIKILVLLQKGSMYTNQILEEFPITQPTLSYHMKILSAAHLVDTRKSGRNVFYSLNKKTFAQLSAFLKKMSE